MGGYSGEYCGFFQRQPWDLEVRAASSDIELLALPDDLDYLFRPVAVGWIKYESLVDGTLSLEDLADINQAIDAFDENRRRLEPQRPT